MGRFSTTATAALVSLVLAGAACSASEPEGAVAPEDAGVDAPSEDAGAEASFPVLPYPAGPYGSFVGGTMPDFRVRGFAMSRTERDPRTLELRDITLAELRSDPACTCLVLVKNASASGCPFCDYEVRDLNRLLEKNPSICALDVLERALGGTNPNDPASYPATRSDLESHAITLRHAFPVGLPTTDARDALSTGIVTSWPSSIVVRTSDMKVLGYFIGAQTNLEGVLDAFCTNGPFNAVETVASDLHARAFALDASFAYVADRDAGILRFALTSAAKTVLASDATERLAVDAANVYFTRSSGAAFDLASVPKSGGAVTVLASGPDEPKGIATDGNDLYFTRSDGVVGRVPVAGGPVTELATGQADPTSIALDETYAYFVERGTGSLARVPKAGGARTVLFTPTTPIPKTPAGTISNALEVVILKDALAVRVSSPTQHVNAIVAMQRDGTQPEGLGGDVGLEALGTSGPERVVVGIRRADRDLAGAVLMSSMPNTLPFLGERNVLSVGGDGTYAYWLSGGGEVGIATELRRARDFPPGKVPF